MQLLPQILFFLLVSIAIFLFARKAKAIRRNILIGKDEPIEPDAGKRLKNLLLLAFGQKKMFKYPLVALMHFIIYAGFIIINVEVLEIVLDGLLGTHRLFQPFLGRLYPFLINAFEWLALGVLLVCVVFLTRRNILKLKRFISRDLNGWPRSDANYILLIEIALMSLFLTMNACDTILQSRNAAHYAEHTTGSFAISQWLAPWLNDLSTQGLIRLERFSWWLHIGGIFAFLNYLPYSKHLHILLAFPNTYYTRPAPQGKMYNMPEIQKEVLLAMGGDITTNKTLASLPDAPPAQFGAKDVFDLGWKNLLDAYSCTECGRCSAACPATITGKVLSPRLIMMKTRDRLEAVGANMDANKGAFADDGKTLLHDYITTEELRACTTCNACVEACPVGISPLDIILKQRRYLILDESNSPREWNAMFGNIENNFAPWKFNPGERDAWMNG
ncbi:(Fe-S)-binding protein [soil metagenome]